MKIRFLFLLAALLLAVTGLARAEPFVDAARGPTPIPSTTEPPRLNNWVNDDTPLPRNYSLQPPIIPHRIDSYQVDKNFNKCLDCHAREKTPFSQATPVSPTHYIDRSGKVLDRISTRRYFCKQCHVPQEPVKPLVGNTFRGDPHDADRTGSPEVPGATAAMHKPAPKK